jgi:AcrR family transcriptional regulator
MNAEKNAKKIDLRIVKTKKALLSALEEMMKQKAFEEIKVSDLCDIAMINRSTFYSHYDDKYDLLQEYINSLKKIFAQSFENGAAFDDSKEYYMDMVNVLFEYISNNRSTFVSIMIHNKNNVVMDMLYDVLSKFIVSKISNREIKSHVPGDVISHFYLGAVFHVCLDWISNNKYTKQEIVDYIRALLPENIYLV